MQTTSKVFMVKPVRFGFNVQTAQDNAFQKRGFEEDAQKNALREFMAVISLIKANGITVVAVDDTVVPHTPDSVFPGGWFSTHSDGTLVLYPMAMPNRRVERKSEFIDAIRQNFNIRRIVDLTHWEGEEQFLEGTQSMVLDREAKIAYACRSSRTSEKVLADFCKQMGYVPVVFDATDEAGAPVCHTDHVMCVGSSFAIVCLTAISSTEERSALELSLRKSGKAVLDVSREQMVHFVANAVELENASGRKFLVMSGAARKCLAPEQVRTLGSKCRLLSPELDFIENNGGCSVGSMMAGLF